jgi:hypothetical protein
MNWADTVKATARTVLAERTATTGRVSVDAPWTWNPYDVWLSRARASRETAAQSPEPILAAQTRRDTAPRG